MTDQPTPSGGTPKGATARARIVLAGGQPLTRWALRRMTEETDDVLVVAEAVTGAEALTQVFGLAPDVVVVDCSLVDSWSLVRQLRDRYPDLGIVVLTWEGSDDLLFRALDMGASAYLNNSASIAEILGAIRHAAVAAHSFSATDLAQALRRRTQATERIALSPRERQVLRLLQEGRSVPEVASTIYVSLSTAKTYVGRLYEKLGASNRAQALMTAVQLGLFDAERSPVAAAG